MDASRVERIASNDATFRAANEQIHDRAVEFGDVLTSSPFLCECADPSCTVVIRLHFPEYERIRENPTWFLNAPGHSVAAGPYGEVVESNPRFEIVAKVGRAGEVAGDLDGRTPE